MFAQQRKCIIIIIVILFLLTQMTLSAFMVCARVKFY